MLDVVRVTSLLKRRKRRWSWLAEAVGVSSACISYWRNRRRNPRWHHVEAIAKALGVQANTLVKASAA